MQSKITLQENEELRLAGLVIHAHYDGALDGWSYRLVRLGEWDKSLAWKKSARACYNFAKREGCLTQRGADSLKAGRKLPAKKSNGKGIAPA